MHILTYVKKVMHIDKSLKIIAKNVNLFLTGKIPFFYKAVPIEETEDWLYTSYFVSNYF